MNNFKLCGAYIHKALLLHHIILPILLLLALFSGEILVLAKYDNEMISYYNYFMKISIPGIYSSCLNDLSR